MLRIAIVEDDDVYAEQLERFARDWAAEDGIDITVQRFRDGMAILDDHAAGWDIILMDIEMPHMDGMTAAARIRTLDERVLIIFITNMAQYAIKGYEVNALDYVLKPINYYAFCLKLRKALRILRERGTRQLMLQGEDGVKLVSTDQLCFVEVWGHKLCYHTTLGDFTITGSRTLQDVEDELNGLGFLRCSQSCLVNARHVQSIGKDEVQVDGHSLKISRGRRKPFLEGMTRYLGGGSGR